MLNNILNFVELPYSGIRINHEDKKKESFLNPSAEEASYLRLPGLVPVTGTDSNF
jgi:hypothetical protein